MKIQIMTILFLAGSLVGNAGDHYPHSSSINPALLYWQAASFLPALSEMQADTMNQIADGKAPYDAGKLKDLDFKQSERFLEKAAASEVPCQWGLAYEDGPGMTMSHLAKMRELSCVALVEAEASFSSDRIARGIDRLFLSHHIARDVAAGGSLIGYLTQINVEKRTIAVAARHCLGWDEPSRNSYLERYGALPALGTLLDGYRGEEVWVDWMESHTETDPQEVVELRRLHLEMQAALIKPENEREAAVAAVKKVFEGTTFRKYAPALGPFMRQEAKMTAIRAMFSAALKQGDAITSSPSFDVQQDREGFRFLVSRNTDAKLRIGK